MNVLQPIQTHDENHAARTASNSVTLRECSELSAFDRINLYLMNLDKLLKADEEGELQSRMPIEQSLSDLWRTIQEAELLHQGAISHAEALSVAQANALVRSAEIIEELEQTRMELLEARLQAEREKEERLGLLSRVFENAREGVVILDATGLVREVNPIFEEISCTQQRHLKGRRFEEVLDWNFPDYANVLRAALSGQSWTGLVSIRQRNQDRRSYQLSISPVQSKGRISNLIAMFSDVTDIERTQDHLKTQALHDQLTCLPNRRFYREKIQHFIESCAGDGGAFAVCFIDLDDFKHVNDSMGHLVGDELLVQVAQRIRQHAGEDAFVARFGGDEFAILIPGTHLSPRKTATVTNGVLQALREPFIVAGTDIRIGASIGVTEYPTQTRHIDELMQFADVAMYAAKKAGRNQIRTFAREMVTGIEKRNQILRELHRALEHNEISLHYQPQVDLRTGECTGCEALARWRTSDGRNVSPAEFVPVAEQSGLVIPLGEVVLSKVCLQLVEWESQGCRPERVAVNLSPRQLYGRRFIDRLKEILNSVGAQPEWICLEITENAVMEDIPHAMKIMDELSEMGIQIALDDFGTGHSSLSYLKQFNVHTLKVDKSFVKDLTVDDRVISIVESVIHLAQGRELKVVAEGIETREQFRILRDMSCDFGQGFYIARPIPAESFASYFAKLENLLPQVCQIRE